MNGWFPSSLADPSHPAWLVQLVPAALAFLTLRLVPLRKLRDRGCDAYYFLLCAEAFRRRPRLPIVLPRLYLLEPQEQWYPPLFSVLLAAFPPRWLHRWHWTVSHGLDLIVGLGLFWSATAIGGAAAGWAALVLYAADGSLIMEYQGLTSRALSAPLLLAMLLAAYVGSQGGGLSWWLVALAAAIALIYAHKLALQLAWFVLPWLALVQQEPAWVVLLGAAYLAAAAVGRSLFVKLVRAHWDIVSFWHRNWPWLGAHQVRQSPVYGDGKPGGFFPSDLRRGARELASRVFYPNPWIVLVAGLLLGQSPLSPLQWFLLQLVAGIYLWALLTIAVPALRCLGEGPKYLKYANPPTLALATSLLFAESATWPWFLAGMLFFWNLRYYRSVTQIMAQPSLWVGTLTPELQRIVARLKELPAPRVMALPTHNADLLAFHARVPVLWGTHGYGFREVEPFFPVLRRRVEELATEHNISHLLLDTRYTSPVELQLDDRWKDVIEQGPYYLARFAPDGNNA